MDTDEFAGIVADDYPRLVRALALSCGDRQVAEDAVQEAMVRAWERLERGDELRSVAGWVAVVAMNDVRSTFRRRAAERRAKERLVAMVGSRPPADVVDRSVDAAPLRLAILTLPARQREVVVLHHLLDLSVDDTASLLGITPGAVKNALFNGRRQLLDRLGGTDDVGSSAVVPSEGANDG